MQNICLCIYFEWGPKIWTVWKLLRFRHFLLLKEFQTDWSHVHVFEKRLLLYTILDKMLNLISVTEMPEVWWEREDFHIERWYPIKCYLFFQHSSSVVISLSPGSHCTEQRTGPCAKPRNLCARACAYILIQSSQQHLLLTTVPALPIRIFFSFRKSQWTEPRS